MTLLGFTRASALALGITYTISTLPVNLLVPFHIGKQALGGDRGLRLVHCCVLSTQYCACNKGETQLTTFLNQEKGSFFPGWAPPWQWHRSLSSVCILVWLLPMLSFTQLQTPRNVTNSDNWSPLSLSVFSEDTHS
jgi:hypothetical protein